ncbi:mCG148439 [Mus musculus]|nr:mCG148439 [Mus musculus]
MEFPPHTCQKEYQYSPGATETGWHSYCPCNRAHIQQPVHQSSHTSVVSVHEGLACHLHRLKYSMVTQ